MTEFMMGFLSGVGFMIFFSFLCALVLVRLVAISSAEEEEPVHYTTVSLNGHVHHKVRK